jgi:hypothetical protein
MRLVSACLLIAFVLVAPGASSQDVKPKIRLEFRVAATELDGLRAVLSRFAATEKFSVENYGAGIPPRNGRPLFWVKLTRGNATAVEILNVEREDRMFVWIYELKPNEDFENTARKLERALHEKWPDIAPSQG